MNKIRFVDNGILYGWFYFAEGQYYGDGSRAEAERIKTEMEVFKDDQYNYSDKKIQ